MTKQTEALKLALEAMTYADACLKKQLTTKDKHQYAQDLLLEAGTAVREALAEQPAQQQQEPIYYMRDNHTFKKLSADVCTALVEIEHEFNEGYTHGALCSKRKGFRDVHASGSVNRLEFFADCKAALEQWLPTAPPSSKPLTNEEIENVWERVQANDFHDCVQPFARAIEAKLKEKNT